MANNDQVSQEYLYVKCFLYKYTPPFTQVTLPPNSSNNFSLSTFAPYSIPLDDTSYFTKYDISGFVTSYSFEQNIDETTYSWSVELQDLALSYGTINSHLKVTPPSGSTLKGGLNFTQGTNSLTLLSEYETGANTFANNNPSTGQLPILGAKSNRGLTPAPLTVQNTNLTSVLSTVHGLRLSDLIQEYDFISLFIYKNQTPLTSIWGTFEVAELQPNNNNPLQFFTYEVTSDTTPAFQNYQNPVDPYLQYESVLLTKMPNGQTLFSNELNGFVIRKSISSAANQVDKVTVSGNGWSRLFGSTRRAIKPSLFQNSLYQAGQVMGLTDVSAFETVYAGRTIAQIIKDLFDLVYRIDFNSTSNTIVSTPTSLILNSQNSTNLATATQNQSLFFAPPLGNTALSVSTASPAATKTTQQLILGHSFYNITSIIVANSYPANLFNLPQYLLATVMKLRPFAYIEPVTVPVTTDFITAAQDSAAQFATSNSSGSAFAVNSVNLTTNSISSIQVPPEIFQQAIQNFSPSEQVFNYGSTNPVFFDPEINNLVAYFQYLAEVFQPFSPELQTPYEILNQIRSVAFVEIYEQPNGQFVVRSPQYNNFATSIAGRSDVAMIRSSNLNIISTSYNETVENLVSKLFVGYSPNVTPSIPGIEQFGYCDGKLLIQNGLLEMDTAANPNAASASLANPTTNNSKTTGIFGYAEYLMEISNAKLKTGTVVCDLDSTIQVGQTFIDETKFKFGYIIGINKHISVTGVATMTLNLSYVRDAVPTYNVDNSIRDINVDLLPVLTDIENSFAPSGS